MNMVLLLCINHLIVERPDLMSDDFLDLLACQTPRLVVESKHASLILSKTDSVLTGKVFLLHFPTTPQLQCIMLCELAFVVRYSNWLRFRQSQSQANFLHMNALSLLLEVLPSLVVEAMSFIFYDLF